MHTTRMANVPMDNRIKRKKIDTEKKSWLFKGGLRVSTLYEDDPHNEKGAPVT